MSIYISLCCLGIDTELIKTIKSAKDNAYDPESIHIGIAFIGNKDFHDSVLEQASMYKNIRSSFHSVEGNLGVGRGRSLATSLYNDEDYFLQVDAHTFFLQDWDKFLIEKFKLACEETNNEKTVLSGFPGKYGYIDDEGQDIFWVDSRSAYPIYLKDMYCLNPENFSGIKVNRFKSLKNLIPRWNPVNDDSFLEKMYSDNNFIPLFKISAAFMFGNKFFAQNTGLYKSSQFWEEEIIQSINLIENKFSLVFNGPYTPINHFYSEDRKDSRGSREYYTDYKSSEDLHYEVAHNMLKYFKHNKIAVKKYNKYIGFNILKTPKKSIVYCPKKYNN